MKLYDQVEVLAYKLEEQLCKITQWLDQIEVLGNVSVHLHNLTVFHIK